ncbi:MAG: hypothetical protein HPM95_06400 [Alphaproteobacteria bacterium]|nr:hypothetical protein [Alphaproteobacteria bacterium]
MLLSLTALPPFWQTFRWPACRPSSVIAKEYVFEASWIPPLQQIVTMVAVIVNSVLVAIAGISPRCARSSPGTWPFRASRNMASSRYDDGAGRACACSASFSASLRISPQYYIVGPAAIALAAPLRVLPGSGTG